MKDISSQYNSYTFNEYLHDEDDKKRYGFTVLENLFVNQVFLSKDKSVLKIIDKDGFPYYFECTGDCCNHVWIEHISGIDNLINSYVEKVDNPNWFFLSARKEIDYDNSTDQEIVELEMNDNSNIDSGFFTLKTNLGNVIIELRNSYNYYQYGGGIIYSGVSSNRDLLKLHFDKISEDF